MKNALIIGSGFGLYGYLPVIVNNGVSVTLPLEYEKRFKSRPELQQFAEYITWSADINTALQQSQSVVIAVNPERQARLLEQCIELSNIKTILLEKPVACTPKGSLNLLRALVSADKTIRIGYNFRFTQWGQSLLQHFADYKACDRLKIEWFFLAHHFRHGLDVWKKRHQDGGGVIRFYGIHLIALLAELGYQSVEYSYTSGVDDKIPERWEACFSAKDLPDFSINVDSRASSNVFKLTRSKSELATSSEVTLFSNVEPYAHESDDNIDKNQDRRYNPINLLCQSFCENSHNVYKHYFAAIELWGKVEASNRFDCLKRGDDVPDKT